MARPLAIALLGAGLLLSGCKSDQEKLIDLRSELRADLDALYARYDGGAQAPGAGDDSAGAEQDGRATAARFFGQLGRSYFDGYCLAHGRGERPFNLSGKLEAFMEDASNQKACRKAAKLELRIRELEEKVGAPR